VNASGTDVHPPSRQNIDAARTRCTKSISFWVFAFVLFQSFGDNVIQLPQFVALGAFEKSRSQYWHLKSARTAAFAC